MSTRTKRTVVGVRTVVIARLGGVRGGDGHHGLGLPRTQKGFYHREATGIDAHAEGPLLLAQVGDQPTRRIAPVQHQQVIRIQLMQMLEKHLPLPDGVGIQLGRQRHLHSWQIQREGRHIADGAATVRLHEQAQLRSIGGHHPPTAPAWGRPRIGNEGQQTRVEAGKHRRRDITARFRERLSADLTP